MKILTVNCVDYRYSTGKIIYDISEALKDRCHFVFCYGTGDPSHDNYYRICGKTEYRFYYLLGRITGLKYATGYTSTLRLIKFIKKQNPDIVHLHCPNTNVFNLGMILNFLKKSSIPTVITNHAEFFYTGNCPHAYECLKFQNGCGNCTYTFDPYRRYLFDRTAYEWKRMKNALNGFERLAMVCVSPWVEERIHLSPIIDKKTLICTILNGIETDIFFQRKSNLKRELGYSDDCKTALHVTASFTDSETDVKGGHYIIRLAERNPDIIFLIAGNNSVKAELPANIRILGEISDQIKLAEYYSLADLCIISGKRETFSMPTAESLCCGTPIIGFKAGGPESIAIPEFSEFCQYDDIDALDALLKKWQDLKYTIGPDVISEVSRKKYSKFKMAKDYFDLYMNILTDKN